jgi:hypothetical protein
VEAPNPLQPDLLFLETAAAALGRAARYADHGLTRSEQEYARGMLRRIERDVQRLRASFDEGGPAA